MKSATPFASLRKKWLAHVGRIRNFSGGFNVSATEVMKIAKKINILLCEARNKPVAKLGGSRIGTSGEPPSIPHRLQQLPLQIYEAIEGLDG